MRPVSTSAPMSPSSMPGCSRSWPARVWFSTSRRLRHSVTSFVPPVSMPSGKANTAIRRGSCWRNPSASCRSRQVWAAVMAHAELTEPVAGEAGASPRRRPLAASLESRLGMLVEIPAAMLVVAEIVILFAGVVARYGLRQPLIWSDELASILFLWLAMLGAAVAFRRSEHMRMTAIVANAKPSMRAYLDVVATCAALGFLVLIAWPSYQYAYEESFITTPALQIPNIWRAAALPAGICLMALFALLRLARSGDARLVLGAVLSVAVLMAIFWLAQPWLRPLGNLNLIIFFVGVAGFCVFAGVPIAFAFGLAIFGYLALTTRTPLMVLVGRMDEGMSHLILLSVPLFVFLGLLIEMAGMARERWWRSWQVCSATSAAAS